LENEFWGNRCGLGNGREYEYLAWRYIKWNRFGCDIWDIVNLFTNRIWDIGSGIKIKRGNGGADMGDRRKYNISIRANGGIWHSGASLENNCIGHGRLGE
jgi:hypothetical protein